MKRTFETRKLYFGFPVFFLGYKDDVHGYNISTSSSVYSLGSMMVIAMRTKGNAIIALANANDRSAIPKMLEIIDKGQNPIHVSTAIWALSQLVREVHPEMIELVMNVKNPTPQIQEEQGRFLEKFGLEEKLVIEN